MTTVEAIEQVFKAAVERIDGVRQAFDYEPDLETLDMPAITIVWADFVQDDTTTGPETDNRWTWDVTVYVGSDIGARESQQQLKRIVAGILAIVREQPKLDNLCDRLAIADGGPPVPDPEAGAIQKTLRLTAHTTER